MSNPAAQAFLQRRRETGTNPQPAVSVPSAVGVRVVNGAVLAKAGAPRPQSKMELLIARTRQKEADAKRKAREEEEQAAAAVDEDEEVSDDDDGEDPDYCPSAPREDEPVDAHEEPEDGIVISVTDMLSADTIIGERASLCPYGASYLAMYEHDLESDVRIVHNLFSKNSSPAHPANLISINHLLTLLRSGHTELMDPALLRMARELIVEKRKGFIPETVRGVYSKHNIHPPAVFPVYNVDELKAYFKSGGGYHWKCNVEDQFHKLSQCDALLRKLDERLFQSQVVSRDLLFGGHMEKFAEIEQNWLREVGTSFLKERGYYDLPHVKAYEQRDQDSDDIGFTVYFPSSVPDEEATAEARKRDLPGANRRKRAKTSKRAVTGKKQLDNDTEDE